MCYNNSSQTSCIYIQNQALTICVMWYTYLNNACENIPNTILACRAGQINYTSFLIAKLFLALWLGILWVLCHTQTLCSLPGFHTRFSAHWWLLPRSILAMIDNAKWWCFHHIVLPCITCLLEAVMNLEASGISLSSSGIILGYILTF